MSSLLMRHPSDAELLHYADGELQARRTREVQSHLEACWQCRTGLEEFQTVVGECVRYRQALATYLPPPPAPWGDIYRRFAEADASPVQPALAERIRAGLRLWAPAAALLALVCALFYQFRDTPSVQAAQLLRRAVAAADARSDQPRRLEIRTRTQRLTRPLPSGRSEADALSSLQALFEAAHYSWEHPLSARSYQAWRDQLADKQDDVITTNDHCYRIRTTTNSGELLEATLSLRVQDLRPVEGTLRFRNQEWVRIRELEEETQPESNVVAERTAGPRAALPAAPQSPAAAPAGELQVLAALHQLGADLGDPIEVTRAGSQILVTGMGVSGERQAQIQDALGAMPNVVVRFSEPAAAAIRPERPTSGGTASPEALRFEARIEKLVGGRADFEHLSARVLDSTEAMMSRAYALRRLADRFPQDAERRLSAEDRQLLGQLYREHAAALAGQAVLIERLLQPVLVSLGASTGGAASQAASSDAWQPATQEMFRQARQVEALMAVMLGSAPVPLDSDALPSQLLSGLAQLRASAETLASGDRVR